MSFRRFHLVLPMLLLAIVSATGCNDLEQSSAFTWQPVFGDFIRDTTPVLAKVGEIKITQRDLEIFMEDLPGDQRNKFRGPDGERLALKRMVDEALLVQAAVEQKLYNEASVARNLIMLRRNSLVHGMRQVGLAGDLEPSEEELKQFYMDNRSEYNVLARINARHIECATEEEADKAYERLQSKFWKDAFPYVCADYSINADTKVNGGDLGWFNRDGFIPYIRDSKTLIGAIFDLEIGVNKPMLIGNRWHVVEISQRQPRRPQTFAEARNRVSVDIMPGLIDGVVKDYLKEARQRYGVELMGEFAPGQGLSPDELFARAIANADPERRHDLMIMLQTDYPDSPRADDALFMAADAAMEAFADLRVAGRLLKQLIEEYPDSELIEDARYLRENLYKPELRQPRSIEDLIEAN